MYRQLMLQPPDGYEFVNSQAISDKVIATLARAGVAHSLWWELDTAVPLNLLKASLERFKKVPEGTVLTYSVGHLVFRKEPWVIDLVAQTLPTGNLRHFKRFSQVTESAFASKYCKKILCQYEAAKKSVLLNYDCTQFKEKIETLLPAVPKKRFARSYGHKDKLDLLFVGSANIPRQFEEKGGRELLDAFALLRRKYRNVQLTVRSDVPAHIKSRYDGLEGLNFVERVLSWSALEPTFEKADVFLMPAYNAPATVMLDAMSYELPIVTVDSWSNVEVVEDGKTGFVIEVPDRELIQDDHFIPPWDLPAFRRSIRRSHPQVVKGLVEKTSILIEDPQLREKMGKGGRWEVEHGKFSIQKRNSRLKRILDEVTS